MTAIVELIVLSACLKCGGTEGWLSWGLWPATSLSALHCNNKQRGSGQCEPSRKCTNCWERKRAAHCTWLRNTAEKFQHDQWICMYYTVFYNLNYVMPLWVLYNTETFVLHFMNQNGWQWPQSSLYAPAIDPSIPAVVCTCFMEELIISCMDSGLVCSHILVPLRSFSKNFNSTTQPYVIWFLLFTYQGAGPDGWPRVAPWTHGPEPVHKNNHKEMQTDHSFSLGAMLLWWSAGRPNTCLCITAIHWYYFIITPTPDSRVSAYIRFISKWTAGYLLILTQEKVPHRVSTSRFHLP